MEDGIRAAPAHASALLGNCVSIDLEVDPSTARILSFAAVRPDRETALVHRSGDPAAALRRLDAFARESAFLLGHNIIRFDLNHLAAASGGLEVIRKPAIDTLWLNPLAFPKNPYHHLVKHHQDGRLQAGHVNDPELDARLTLEVLRNQIEALTGLGERDPDLLTAFHWLTAGRADEAGFDAVFRAVRGRPRPETDEARRAVSRILASEACVHQIASILDDPERSGWPLAYPPLFQGRRLEQNLRRRLPRCAAPCPPEPCNRKRQSRTHCPPDDGPPAVVFRMRPSETQGGAGCSYGCLVRGADFSRVGLLRGRPREGRIAA